MPMELPAIGMQTPEFLMEVDYPKVEKDTGLESPMRDRGRTRGSAGACRAWKGGGEAIRA